MDSLEKDVVGGKEEEGKFMILWLEFFVGEFFFLYLDGNDEKIVMVFCKVIKVRGIIVDFILEYNCINVLYKVKKMMKVVMEVML